MDLTLQSVPVIEEFRALHKQFKMSAQTKNINFTVENNPDIETALLPHHRFRIDPVRFGQVTRNLLTNAFKFTPVNGSIRIALSRVDRSDDNSRSSGNAWLRVEVIDSGAGISKENQKKLFGKYAQFNANALQKGGGSGLGLWISKGEWTSLHEMV